MSHIQFQPDTSVYDWVMKNRVDQPNGQTLFSCPWHGPATGPASGFPDHGDCQGCLILWMLRLDAVTPPDQREELFYNLNKYMLNAVQLAESGNFDLQIDRHPQVEITLDPNDFADTPIVKE